MEREEGNVEGFYLRIVDNVAAKVSVVFRPDLLDRSKLIYTHTGDSRPRGGTRSGKSIEHTDNGANDAAAR